MGEFLHIGAELLQIGTAIANRADLLQVGSPIINFGSYEKLVYNANNLFISFHSNEFQCMNHVAFAGTFTTNLLILNDLRWKLIRLNTLLLKSSYTQRCF